MTQRALVKWAILIGIITGVASANAEYKSMLIITHPQYRKAADSLAAWKQQMGYTIWIASHSAWTEDEVKDTSHHYIKDNGCDFICLLGDIDKVASQSY